MGLKGNKVPWEQQVLMALKGNKVSWEQLV